MTGQHGPIQGVTFSPDGTLLASSSKDGSVFFRDPSTGARAGEAIRLAHPGDLHGLAFSPNGELLATGFVDGSVSLWDPATGKRVAAPLTGQTTMVTALTFSPDGRVLASGSFGGDISLWDVRNHRQIGGLLPGYGQVWSLSFAPDGRSLAAGGDGGTVFIRDGSAWSSDLALLSLRICLVAGRNLTQAEWSEFLPSEPYRRTCPDRPAAT
jgi:WD40 repeat protein